MHAVITMLMLSCARLKWYGNYSSPRRTYSLYIHHDKPIHEMSSDELHIAANKCLREFKL